MPKNSSQELKRELQKSRDPKRAEGSKRYFKTGPGEYGEGDIFFGQGVPEQRNLAKKYLNLSLADLAKFLKSPIHEYRQVALFILTYQYPKASKEQRKKIFDFYLKNTKGINNWDLVDSSAPKIVGEYLQDKNRTILYQLVKSKNLWERRISVLATFAFIKNGDFTDALKIAKILLPDAHDLIHKAVGWMLREVGKRDLAPEKKFLDAHASQMPRTMLRYAIEKFPETERKKYLRKIPFFLSLRGTKQSKNPLLF